MIEAAPAQTSLLFSLFKSLMNGACDPRVSFALAVGVLVVGMSWMKIWRMWVGYALLVLVALGLWWGWQDPHFSGHDMLGKADNLPIVAMIFLFGWALWYAMSQALNNDRRMAEKLPPEEKETSCAPGK